jgi:hypothetical protein
VASAPISQDLGFAEIKGLRCLWGNWDSRRESQEAEGGWEEEGWEEGRWDEEGEEGNCSPAPPT